MKLPSHVIGITALMLLSCSLHAQSGSIVQDEHDKRIKADTERNTKYHNNADDYPVNKPTPTPAPVSKPAAPYLTSSDIHDMYVRADAARAQREAEYQSAYKRALTMDEDAMMKVADYIMRGYGTTKDKEGAMLVYRTVAQQGPTQAYHVGLKLSEPGDAQDNGEAWRSMKLASDGGNAAAKKWLDTHRDPLQQRGELPSMLLFADEAFRARGVGIAPTSPGKGDAVLAELNKVFAEKYTNWKKSYKVKLEALAAGKATLYGLGVPADPKAAAVLLSAARGGDDKEKQAIQDIAEYSAWAQWALYRQSGSKDASVLTWGAVEPDPRSAPTVEYARAVLSCAAKDFYRQRAHLNQASQTYFDGKHYVKGPSQPAVDLAVMELEGLGGSVDEKAGMAELQTAADSGNANAKYILGLIYERGLHGATKDPARAAQLFKAAADAGQAQARERLTNSASLAKP